MYRLNIKPFSVNRARSVRAGRVISSKSKKEFQKKCLILLIRIRKGSIKIYPKMKLHCRWGMSYPEISDWDNPMKPFQDLLAKRFDFDDNQIWFGSAEKIKSKKPFIEFTLTEYRP